MPGIRFPLLAAIFCMLLPGNATLASEQCDLATAYLLGSDNNLGFAVSIHRCAGFWRLELKEFGGRTASGEPLWNVLDLIEIPKIASDEVIVAQTCSIGGVEDQGIVVVALQTEEDWYDRIRVARWADREHRRWDTVDAATVRCWNEGAGL